jgi:hypothetical protein
MCRLFLAVYSSAAVKNMLIYQKVIFQLIKKLSHPIPPADKPDLKAAQALKEGIGGSIVIAPDPKSHA